MADSIKFENLRRGKSEKYAQGYEPSALGSRRNHSKRDCTEKTSNFLPNGNRTRHGKQFMTAYVNAADLSKLRTRASDLDGALVSRVPARPDKHGQEQGDNNVLAEEVLKNKKAHTHRRHRERE